MDPMPHPRPPHLVRQINRHGTPVWYVRVGHGSRTRIRAKFGTPEFNAEYQAAINGEAAPKPGKFHNGTLGWLVARYRESAAWLNLSPATRRQRENIFHHVLEAAGQEPISRITRKVIVAGRDRRKPNAGRHFVQTMRGLFEWAVEAEHVATDPTLGVDTPRPKTDGHAIWPPEWCAKFETRWALGTRERVAYEVVLQTGLRRGDLVRIGRPHVRDNIATIRTEKGEGEVVTIPINAALRAAIDAGPIGELTWIVGAAGRPLTKESFGNWFREACKAADVPGSAHGLRKTKATNAAERGATEHELDAMFGWKDGKTSRIYTRKANRAKLALAGAAKLERKTNI